jgi:hypothetical protein
MNDDIALAKSATADHEWFDALNHFAQAIQIADKHYPPPKDYDNEVDTLLSRCIGFIGGQIIDAVGGASKERYLEFRLAHEGEKTSTWDVVSVRHGDLLGIIRWWGAWRQYTFFPSNNTVFNPDCLREISAFIEDQMKARKKRKAVL